VATHALDEARESDAAGLAREVSSHVRVREHGPSARARRRVGEYLRALGLLDEARIDALSQEIAAAGAHPGEEQNASPEHAVAEAQRRVQAWRADVFGTDEQAVQPLWLRAFLMAHPEALLASPLLARALAHRFGDPRTGVTRVRARFSDQSFSPARASSWFTASIAKVGAAIALAALALAAACARVASLLELTWWALFAFLLGLSAIGAATAAVGFFAPRRRATTPQLVSGGGAAALPRSALLMPIYHESAERVFAAIAAMRESLAATPGGDAFEIFVLSDSRDPGCAAAEERALRRIAAADGARIPVYYRRRTRNDRCKAGNLAEFFERWGDRYTYAVVLDADSLMRGDTLVELLRRMERSPRVALLQAPLALHRGRTLFARAQQFAADVHGPLFSRGLALLSGPHGNYYGHNAVLRVRAFLDCCALPLLAGDPPLGGHVLSHDFVEAALLCRAGWEVRSANDLGGSFEELPATLPDYVARDRRWCQGNLQHLRIVRAAGLRAMSRVHMLLGAAHYLAGPAWLAFVALGLLFARPGAAVPLGRELACALAGATAVVLLLPKLLGLFARLRAGAAGHGGALRVICGVALETLLAGLLAPLMMVHHTRIVFAILLGGAVPWESRRAAQRGGVLAVVSHELPATLLGAGLVTCLARTSPELLPWLSPLLGPWLLAVPIALLVSSRRAGALAARLGLFTLPSELSPDELAQRASELRALTMGDDAARFRDLVLDPVLLSSHLSRIAAAAHPPAAQQQFDRLRERALRAGPAALSAEQRERLSGDAESMRWLHRHAWRSWPVESWQIGRDQPQLPHEYEPENGIEPALAR
jgi:membrane glycosyltransferase